MLSGLLRQQHGVVTRAQALAAGVSPGTIRRHLDARRWQRPWPGVYVTFSGPLPRMTYLWAVVLTAGPGAVLSHETAAELNGLLRSGEASRGRAPARVVHVTVPVERTVRRIPGVVVHRSTRIDGARHPSRQPPQTRVEETVLDLTQTAHTVTDAYGWLALGVNTQLTTVDRLIAAIARRPRLRWRRLLLEGLGGIAEGCRSVLELTYLRDVERVHGLPRAARQLEVRVGGVRNYLDVVYRAYRVRVELDGRATHPFHLRFRDADRDNAAVLADDRPLRYGTGAVLEHPCRIARDVVILLHRGGWPGSPIRCGRTGCVFP